MMSRILLLIALLLSISCNKKNQDAIDRTDSTMVIRVDEIDNYLTQGIDKSDMHKALSGDIKSAQKIVYELETAPEESYYQHHYWLMISAENGSIQAMYDLAIISNACNPRSQFWGKKFLESTDPATTSKPIISMREGVIKNMQEQCR